MGRFGSLLAPAVFEGLFLLTGSSGAFSYVEAALLLKEKGEAAKTAAEAKAAPPAVPADEADDEDAPPGMEEAGQ